MKKIFPFLVILGSFLLGFLLFNKTSFASSITAPGLPQPLGAEGEVVTIVGGTAQWAAGGGAGDPTEGGAGAVQFSDGSNGHNADDSNLFWDNTSKELGIGTNSPDSQLHVENAGFAEVKIENSGVASTSSVGLRMVGGENSPISVAEVRALRGTDTMGAIGFERDDNDTSGRLSFYTVNGGAIAKNLQVLREGDVEILNGKLAIGFTGAAVQVHARQTASNELRVESTNVGTNAGFRAKGNQTTDSLVGWYQVDNGASGAIGYMGVYRDGANTDGHLEFHVYNSDADVLAMTIEKNGDIEIHEGLLTVEGDAASESVIITQAGDADGTDAVGHRIYGTGKAGDANTEYLEYGWNPFGLFAMTPMKTGTGVQRQFLIGADPTGAQQFIQFNPTVADGGDGIVFIGGEVAVDLTTPQVRLSGSLRYDAPQSTSLIADNQNVDTSADSYLRLSSDSGTATDRTFTLEQGAQGKMLTIEWEGANLGELVDGSAQGTGGNHRLNGDWSPNLHDTITLISNGTDWLEVSRSSN